MSFCHLTYVFCSWPGLQKPQKLVKEGNIQVETGQPLGQYILFRLDNFLNQNK